MADAIMEDLLEPDNPDVLSQMLDDNVLSKIEGMLKNIVDSLARTEPLEIVLKKRPRAWQMHSIEPAPNINLRFPGTTAHEAWRFSATLGHGKSSTLC